MAPPVYQRETPSFARVLGFLNAIYAFAVTLLVVKLDATSPEAWRSIDALVAHGMGFQLLGFGISFVVIVAFCGRPLVLLFSTELHTTVSAVPQAVERAQPRLMIF